MAGMLAAPGGIARHDGEPGGAHDLGRRAQRAILGDPARARARKASAWRCQSSASGYAAIRMPSERAETGAVLAAVASIRVRAVESATPQQEQSLHRARHRGGGAGVADQSRSRAVPAPRHPTAGGATGAVRCRVRRRAGRGARRRPAGRARRTGPARCPDCQRGTHLFEHALHRRQHLGALGKAEHAGGTLRLELRAGQDREAARARDALIRGGQRRARCLRGGGGDHRAGEHRLVATDATDKLAETELRQDRIELDRGIEPLGGPAAMRLTVGRHFTADAPGAVRWCGH